MKIDQSDETKVTLELENPESFQAFRAGIEDKKNWFRTPETTELSDFVRNNNKFAQIFVKYGDSYQRVK